ncbi:ABC-2 type transport system ATP-binding protein [Saccharopolyspora kobensis]|uniref:ABC-2 type transport system ATP-binding protein n=1 Tax=Saccharopolyspora kobensis TaxID=146035 RepID=A0A1H6C9W2_9PSEU|nr:ABC transporter ATP-binding protein [Saccharopolyspora kobensis]SEG69750.1 ABC-2 type transport system ATP-binding protein [Saccharopolyspora kobensis]SFC33399.1 ABC-2 type transport system ATP-binding protein [Saccharopolyspora kobensis]
MSSGEVPAVRAHQLAKRYRRGWALRGCSLSLPQSRVVALVGHNGAGKSTLMGLIAGLLKPTEGAIEVFGRRPSGTGAPEEVAYVAQQKPLYPGLTVSESLRFAARMNTRWDQGYAEQLIRAAEVPFEAKVGKLSGGQRTRVALVLALGKRPGLLMLDEPLAELDPLAREATMRTLQEESRLHGIGVLLSSHVLEELETVCDHLVLLGNGRVRLDGPVADLVAGHRVLRGSGQPPVASGDVVDSVRSGQEQVLITKRSAPVAAPGWREQAPRLNDIALAYMRNNDDAEVAA